MKKSISKSIKVLLVGVIFFFIGRTFLGHWAEIKNYSWQLEPTYFAISFVIVVTAFLLNSLGWHLILRLLGIKLPLLETARIWFLSHLGRYLPGYIWQFIGRIAFLNEHNVTKKRAVLSLYLESASVVLAATLTALISMLLSTNELHGVSLNVIYIAITSCIVLMHPKVLQAALNIFLTMLKKEKVVVSYRFSKLLLITAFYIVFWFIVSAGSFFLIKSVYEIDASIFFNISFAFTASWVIGFLTIFAPAGIGVREGALIMLLNQTLPGFIVPVIAIITRLWTTSGEMLTMSSVLALSKINKRAFDPKGR